MATEDIYNEFDRLSNLPENLLCSEILSRLPLTDTVRSSLLARKWRYLWTKIPHLHFLPDFFRQLTFSGGRRRRLGNSSRHIEETMEHVLFQHDAPLEGFRFHLPMSISIEAMDIHQCIHYAAEKAVKRMNLVVHPVCVRMHLPFSFFSCTNLVDLKLAGFTITQIPLPSENFSFLTACCLRDIRNLTNNELQRLVELCPLLQKLSLTGCEELKHMKIQSPRLHYLILVDCTCAESLTADFPQLLQLIIRDCFNLAQLQINSYGLVELKLRDCYKLSRLQLNSYLFLKEAGPLEGLSLEGHSIVESLKKISIKRCSTALSDLLCLTFFGTFPDLEELQVSSCIMGIALIREHDQAAREIEMISNFAFPNLKNAYLAISADLSEKEVIVSDFLLRNAPMLKTLALPYCFEDIDDLEFKNELLGLKRASAEVEIIWKKDDDEESEEHYREEYEDPDRGWGYGNGNDSLEREWVGYGPGNDIVESEWESENNSPESL